MCCSFFSFRVWKCANYLSFNLRFFNRSIVSFTATLKWRAQLMVNMLLSFSRFTCGDLAKRVKQWITLSSNSFWSIASALGFRKINAKLLFTEAFKPEKEWENINNYGKLQWSHFILKFNCKKRFDRRMWLDIAMDACAVPWGGRVLQSFTLHSFLRYAFLCFAVCFRFHDRLQFLMRLFSNVRF